VTLSCNSTAAAAPYATLLCNTSCKYVQLASTLT
jgi:hypothetical protein